jgi:hypothetical protein
MSRDFQRSAVYAWERKQFPNIYAGNMELAACVEMAHMMYGAWVSVEDGRGRRRGCARTSRRRPTISLPRFARSPEYLAHEIAHLIVERDDRGAPSHGGIFMGHYLTLLSPRGRTSMKRILRHIAARKNYDGWVVAVKDELPLENFCTTRRAARDLRDDLVRGINRDDGQQRALPLERSDLHVTKVRIKLEKADE